MAKFIFDLDGVLVKSRDRNKNFIWQKNIESDLGIDAGLIARIFAPTSWNKTIMGHADFRDTLNSIAKDSAHKINPDLFIDYWLRNDLHWYQDIIQVARNLKSLGHQLFIGTNQDKIRSSFLRSQEVLFPLFEQLIASCDLNACKPSSDFFLRAKKLIAATNSEKIIFIDDSEKNIEAARDIGMVGIYFNPDVEPGHNSNLLQEKIEAALT